MPPSTRDIDMNSVIVSPAEIFKRFAEAYSTIDPLVAITSERNLEDMKCGELRWSEREQGWEVLVSTSPSRTATSSFFGQNRFGSFLPQDKAAIAAKVLNRVWRDI